MDNWSVWQHLRFQTLSDMLLEDGALAREQQSGRSGESVFPRGTLAFSYVDKGYENLKDVVQTLGWTYTCRATSQPEEPPGVAIGLTKDSTAAGGTSVLRQDLEQQLAESLRRFPAVVAAHQPALKDAMESAYQQAFATCAARLEARRPRPAADTEAQRSIPPDVMARLAAAGIPTAAAGPKQPTSHLSVVAVPYEDGSVATLMSTEAEATLTLTLPVLVPADQGDDATSVSRAVQYIVFRGVLTAIAAGAAEAAGVTAERAMPWALCIIAATISELRRKNQVGAARFPISLLEQVAHADMRHGRNDVEAFCTLRLAVEFPDLVVDSAKKFTDQAESSAEPTEEELQRFTAAPLTYAQELGHLLDRIVESERLDIN
jgi:hypothetical protein